MSRQVSVDKPLSPEDREYLLMRGEEARVAWFDTTYPPDAQPVGPEPTAPADEQEAEEFDADAEAEEDDEEDEEDPDYENWTIADLKAEIEERNTTAASPMSVTGVKADLAKRLREDDAAKE